MSKTRVLLVLLAAGAVSGVERAGAQHACDALGERGWRTVPTVETTSQSDGAPYQVGASWFVDRTTTLLPFCNYYNSVGNYSLRSYTLSPETRTERVEICRNLPQGGSAAVAPYTGRCPPS
jgi:hypothetical protein